MTGEPTNAGRGRLSRNPGWTRDELILALDVYLDHRPRLPGKTSAIVRQLSDDLRAQWPAGTGNAEFRNVNGAYLRLTNFCAVDPLYTGDEGRVGMRGGGGAVRLIFEEMAHDPAEVKRQATAIRMRGLPPEGSPPPFPLDPDEGGAMEGGFVRRAHLAAERNAALVARKKATAMRAGGGRLACEACGFDFVAAYGPRGTGFAECHHRDPVALRAEPTETRLQDLAIVCANCHRMIHRGRPLLTVEELRALIVAAAEKPPGGR
jgi:5-methylcytosine-specific restriction protein A